MAVLVQWEAARRINEITGEKVVTRGEQQFATLAAARNFLTNALDNLDTPDLYKARITIMRR